jgi:hypothetical protein
MRSDSFHRDTVAKDLPDRIVVESVRAAHCPPVLIVGQKRDSIWRGAHRRYWTCGRNGRLRAPGRLWRELYQIGLQNTFGSIEVQKVSRADVAAITRDALFAGLDLTADPLTLLQNPQRILAQNLADVAI